jgi:hypothetical protein
MIVANEDAVGVGELHGVVDENYGRIIIEQ